MVAPTFVRQALAGEPITISGDGTQSRCFGWAGDAVDALIALSEHPDSSGKVFNIGHNQEARIRELAERLIRITQSPSTNRMIPYGEAYAAGFEDMQRRIPSLERIPKLMPPNSLDQMLEANVRTESDRRLHSPAPLVNDRTDEHFDPSSARFSLDPTLP